MLADMSGGMRAPVSCARLALLFLLFAAATSGSRELQQQDGATLPPAAEAQSGGSCVGKAPPAGQTAVGLAREGAAEEFAADQPGSGEYAGDVPPEDVPADDVAALLGSEAAALGGISGSSSGCTGGTSGGDIFDGGGMEEQPPVQPTNPSKRVGRAISLLRPPPGFIPPELTQEQRDMIPKLQKARQGAATVAASREVGNLAAASLNCGMAYLNDHYRTHYVGIPSELYRKGELCGACVRMWCVDSICENALVNNTLFMVVDSCQDCSAGNLVASSAGLRSLSGGVNVNANPTLQVAWAFESCAPLITGKRGASGGAVEEQQGGWGRLGGIRLWPSDRTSPEFLGLQLSNVRGLLKGATLNGVPLQRTDYGYWVIDTPGKNIPLRPPYELILVSTSNQRIGKRLANLRAQDLGINFS